MVIPIEAGPSDRNLFDEAEIGGQRLALVRSEVACDHRHRRPGGRMISLAPLLEPALEIEIGQASETRDISHAFCVRTVAGIAGHDIGFRNPFHIDRSAARRERIVAIIGGVWGGSMQNSWRDRAPYGDRAPQPRPTCIASKMDCCARARENS